MNDAELADEGPEATLSRELRRGLPFCVTVFVIVRVALSILGVVTVRDSPPLQAGGFPRAGIDRPVDAGWHNAVDGTYRWDAGWFVRIAEDGYDPVDGSAEFYPAQPLASRAVAAILPIGPLGAAILVANLAFLLALIVLYALTTLEYSDVVARRSVVLLASFPASFIFMSPYSESVFLLTTVTAFYLARRDRWAGAAVSGVVATATRAAGVLIIPALAIEAWMTGDRAIRGRRIVAAAIPIVGLLAYLGYWQLRVGDAFLPLRAPQLWDRTVQFPLAMFGRAVGLGFTGVTDPDGILWTMDLALTACVLIPLLWGWRLLRLSYLVYAALTLLTVLTVTYAPRPLVGAPRYSAVLFPAFWILGSKLRGRSFLIVTGLFGVGYLVVATTFMNQRSFVF